MKTRLTESQFKAMISKCVNQAIAESYNRPSMNEARAEQYIRSMVNEAMDEGIGGFVSGAAKTVGSKIKNALGNVGTRIKNGYDSVKQFGQDVYKGGMEASRAADTANANKRFVKSTADIYQQLLQLWEQYGTNLSSWQKRSLKAACDSLYYLVQQIQNGNMNAIQ